MGRPAKALLGSTQPWVQIPPSPPKEAGSVIHSMTLPASPVSPRLRYEPATDDDVATLTFHWGHPAVHRFLFDDEPPEPDLVERIVARSAVCFDHHRVGMWLVHTIDGGAFVGVVALLPVPDESGDIELLYSLEPESWGLGYATEAVGAVTRAGFAHAGLRQIFRGLRPTQSSLRRGPGAERIRPGGRAGAARKQHPLRRPQGRGIARLNR